MATKSKVPSQMSVIGIVSGGINPRKSGEEGAWARTSSSVGCEFAFHLPETGIPGRKTRVSMAALLSFM